MLAFVFGVARAISDNLNLYSACNSSERTVLSLAVVFSVVKYLNTFRVFSICI